MGRKLRTTDSRSIVIVCEGTDTEVKYFTDMATYVRTHDPDRFVEFRVVPTAEEFNSMTARNKQKKKLKDVNNWWGYYYQEEASEELYNKYRKQPTRYVREAQLFLLDGSYGEAWAVYDFDEFPDHETAYKIAEENDNLHIGFSSVSFEEWILLHFERNPFAFKKSVCKENKHDIFCGSSKHPNDCHGTICVAGRIREKNFIPSYDKTMDSLFTILLSRHKTAMINAAWTRDLHIDKSDYESNPFTNIDKLTSHLLGVTNNYIWVDNVKKIQIGNTFISLESSIIHNIGSNSCVLYICGFNEKINPLDCENKIHIFPGESFEYNSNNGASFLGMREGNITYFKSLK